MIVNKIPKLFLEKIFWIQNQIQFNHWKEEVSGWQHEVLGDYYKKLNEQIDSLVEGVAGSFTRQAINISDEMYKVLDDMDNISLVKEINSLFIEFRNELQSENGIVNVIDNILELNNSTIYKLGLR